MRLKKYLILKRNIPLLMVYLFYLFIMDFWGLNQQDQVMSPEKQKQKTFYYLMNSVKKKNKIHWLSVAY